MSSTTQTTTSKRKSSRALAGIVAIFALVFATLTASPASATTVHSVNAGQDYTVTIGDTFSKDFSCTATAGEVITGTNYQSGVIPTGMTWNNGVLSGTATALGDYTFGDWQCLFDQGGMSWQSVGGAHDWVTIHVVAPATPAPYVTISNLNDAACGLRVIGSMPAVVDPNSAKLLLTVGSTTWILSLKNFGAGELVDITASGNDLSLLAADQSVTSYFKAGTGSDNVCNSLVSATLAYQHAGAPASTATASTTPTMAVVANTNPIIDWQLVGDSACTVRLTAVWPSLQTGATPHIYLATGTFGYNIWLSGVEANTIVTRDFPLMNPTAFSDGTVTGLDHFNQWGDAPVCDGTAWWASTDVADATGTLVGSPGNIRPSLPPVPAALCEPGTYSITGRVPCDPAEPGYFVSQSGSQFAMPCPLGYFSSELGKAFCTPAPKGSFVAGTGAKTATPCDAGKTTVLVAARSVYECYKQEKQSARGIRVLTVYKAGTKLTMLKTTDLYAPLTLSAVGACSVSEVMIADKVKGKKKMVGRFLITIGQTGNCTLTFANAGTEKYAPFSMVKKFKITKTGK